MASRPQTETQHKLRFIGVIMTDNLKSGPSPQASTPQKGVSCPPPSRDAAMNSTSDGDFCTRLHRLSLLRCQMVGTAPLAQRAKAMAEQLRAAFGMDACVFRLWKDDDLVFLACSGLEETDCPERIPIGCGIASEILKRQSPLFLPDVMSNPVLAAERSRPPSPRAFTSYAGAPMLAGDQVIGIIGLFSRTMRTDLTEADLDALQIMANYMSLAIANDELYAQLLTNHERIEQETLSRKEAERQLRESEQRLRLAAETARMFAFEWDAVTDKIACSADASDVLGRADNAAIDCGAAYLDRVHPDDRPALAELLAQLSPTQPGYRTTYRFVRDDGGVVWIEENAHGFFDETGRLVRLVGMASDVTDRKRAEGELRRLREELARMARITAMGELTATIAHEVNQPLGAVTANAQACQRLLNSPNPDHDEIRRALVDIVNDATRATQVVAQVRRFLGRVELRLCPVDMNGAIRQVVRMADDRLKADQVSLKLRLKRDLPPVSGAEIQLQQVVFNLLLNAIEAVSQVTVSSREITVSSECTDAATVLVTVRDRGMGIPADDCERIFDAFFTTKPGGVGMGLAVCRSIVEAHGGRLWVESVEGAGSAFKFTIPIARAS